MISDSTGNDCEHRREADCDYPAECIAGNVVHHEA